MNTYRRAAVITLLLASSVSSGAAGEAPAPGTWEKVKAYSHQQKEEAVAEGRKLIAATDRQIAELAKLARASAGEVKVEHEKNMNELKAKKQEAQAQLDKLGKAGSNVWEATREGFSNAGKDLQAAYEKAAASARN